MKLLQKTLSFTLIFAILLSLLPTIPAAAATTFSGGSGTVSDPYLVATASDLINVRNYNNKFFRQTRDISMSGQLYFQVSEFSGTYDGGGYTIRDLNATATGYTYAGGLFSYNRGTVKNVKMENCTLTASATSSNLFCGGIVGYNSSGGKIINCSFSGSVSGSTAAANREEYVGGITGLNLGTVEDCRNYASVTADATGASDIYAGGIVGNNNTTIKNCLNEGKIRAVNSRNCLAGGIAAINFGTVSGVKNTAEIYACSTRVMDGYSSDGYAGGAVGYNKGTVSYAENSGFIRAESTADNAEAGGITAYTGGSYQDVGGYTVEKSRNTGDVTAHSTAGESRAGGITGTCYKNSYIRYCCNEGDVSATENKLYNLGLAGGVAGTVMYGTMMQSCNHGDVTVSTTKYYALACGLAETTAAVITDCYNEGNVYVNSKPRNSYDYSVGSMLFQDSDTTCLNCYNLGRVTAAYSMHRRYGLYGISGGTDRNSVQNCFTTDYTGTTASQRMTAAQACQKETFVGYDFEHIWAISPDINGGHPYLRNVPAPGDAGFYIDPDAVVSVTGVSLSASSLTMAPGERTRLTATVRPPEALDTAVTWSSSAPTVADVDGQGMVTAYAPGSAVITVRTRDGGYTARCQVTVPALTPAFSGGSGTSADPYLIATAEDLQNILYAPTAHFRQVADISLEGVSWVPIGSISAPFGGTYDGAGYIIRDLALDVTDGWGQLGLFGASGGTVKRVKMVESRVIGYSTVSDLYCGTVVAYNTGTVSDCHVRGDVSATTRWEEQDAYAGGVIGYSTTSVSSCTYDGTVDSKVNYLDSFAYSGGIVAYGQGASGCQNHGTIRAEASASCDAYAGGILGYAGGYVSRCYNAGQIRATYSRRSFAGGITGCNRSTVYGCKNAGEIFASTAFNDDNDALYALAGGISGSNFGTVNYTQNTALIHAASTSSHAYAGGIVGYNNADATLQNSKNTGDVKAGSSGGESRAGGIASSTYRDSIVRRCCNEGDVSIYDNPYYWLGLAGGVTAVLQYGTVTECCNHGDVTIDSSAYYPIGNGITSFTDSTLTNCYSDGNVYSSFARHESYNPGMICGIGEGCGTAVSHCYFAGALTSRYSYTERYGFLWTNGRGGNTLSDCYALNRYSTDSTAGGTVITAAASQQQATYAGFDFTSIWAIDPDINGGRPYLRNIPDDASSGFYHGAEELPIIGHTEGGWIVEKEASCTEAGNRYTVCVDCGARLRDEAIPATGHSHTATVTPPTCEARGYTTHTCHCGDSYVDSYVAARGHSFGEWYVSEVAGEERRDCTRCDGYEVRPALPAVIPGDANGDRAVDEGDLELIREYVIYYDYDAGLSAVPVSEGADVNGDGRINTLDIIALRLMLILGVG